MVRVVPERLFSGGELFDGRNWRRLADVASVLGVFELLDEIRRLLRGEFPSRLTLCEPHRAARIAEVGVPSALQKLQEFVDLSPGGRRP